MGLSVEVTNLSAKATLRDLHDFFSFSGPITAIYLKPPVDGGAATAFVTFADEKSVETALLLSESSIKDSIVTVQATAPDYEPPPEAKRYSTTPGEGATEGSPLKQAEAMVKKLVEQGYTLGKETAQKARELDSNALTRSATSKAIEFRDSAAAAATDLDKRLNISHTLAAGSERVTEAMNSVDSKYHLSETTQGVFAQAEEKLHKAGEYMLQNKFIAQTRDWVMGTAAKVSDLVEGGTDGPVGAVPEGVLAPGPGIVAVEAEPAATAGAEAAGGKETPGAPGKAVAAKPDAAAAAAAAPSAAASPAPAAVLATPPAATAAPATTTQTEEAKAAAADDDTPVF